MADVATPVKLAEAEVPSFEVLEREPVRGVSELFPDQVVEYCDTEFLYFNRVAYPEEDTTLYRLMGEVEELRGQTIAEEGIVPKEETEKMLMAASLQESLILGINGMIGRLASQGISTLKATYIIDNYIERRDQKLWARYSGAIEEDTQLIEALEEGGEFPVPGHETEMISDFSGTTAQLGRRVAANLLSMERLRFEWVSATAMVEAVRKEAPRSLMSGDF
ncbi:MAG TPA: hypothetical protein VFW77_03585 [Candidatus Saccharimonadales bacterium]|nr:hypothetical protein [Candidatus Saccharimonadales bacterium]